MRTMTDEERRKGQEVLAARRAEVAAQRVELTGDAAIYPDQGAGVGWVLDTPNHVKRYYGTKEQALERARELGFPPA